jgi:hypothetical protein
VDVSEQRIIVVVDAGPDKTNIGQMIKRFRSSSTLEI